MSVSIQYIIYMYKEIKIMKPKYLLKAATLPEVVELLHKCRQSAFINTHILSEQKYGIGEWIKAG